MKVYLKYDINVTFKTVLEKQLKKLEIPYKINGLGEIEFIQSVNTEKMKELTTLLSIYGISIINDHKTELVQRIKDNIYKLISSPDEIQTKTSVFLSDQLGYSYTYLSNLFSEHTYTSIENFIIISKVDRAKTLITEDKLTLTEIAHQLGYSSVAHLSAQFKKTTGLTPTSFQKIIKARKNTANMTV